MSLKGTPYYGMALDAGASKGDEAEQMAQMIQADDWESQFEEEENIMDLSEKDKFPPQTRVFPLKEGKVQINWAVAVLAYKEYLDNHEHGEAQSLESIAERGGFGVAELMNLLCGRIERIESSLTEAREGIGRLIDPTQSKIPMWLLWGMKGKPERDGGKLIHGSVRFFIFGFYLDEEYCEMSKKCIENEYRFRDAKIFIDKTEANHMGITDITEGF